MVEAVNIQTMSNISTSNEVSNVDDGSFKEAISTLLNTTTSDISKTDLLEKLSEDLEIDEEEVLELISSYLQIKNPELLTTLSESNIESSVTKSFTPSDIKELINFDFKINDELIKNIKDFYKGSLKESIIEEFNYEVSNDLELNTNKLDNLSKTYLENDQNEMLISQTDINSSDTNKSDIDNTFTDISVENVINDLTVDNTMSKSNELTSLETITKSQMQENIDKITHEVNMFKVNLSEGDTHKVTLKLTPKSLGEITVELNMKEGTLNGVINVDNLKAKDMLTDILNDIKNQLTKQNVDVGNLDINYGNGSNDDYSEKYEYIESIRNINTFNEFELNDTNVSYTNKRVESNILDRLNILV